MGLIIENLSVNASSHPILKSINISVPSGKILSLMGPSGSGKSTLARTILGLATGFNVAGKIYFYEELLQHDNKITSPISKRRFAYVPQNLSLWPHLSVIQTILLTRSFAPTALNIDELLVTFQLDNLKTRRPHELSQGEQQRLALARAMASNPRLLIMDEPFSGLDTVLRLAMVKLLKSVVNDRLTIIFISHDLAETNYLGGDLLILINGQKAWAGPSADFEADLPEWPLLKSHRQIYLR